MREKIILYKTDASFDYGDFDYKTEDEHGIELDINGTDVNMDSLEGFGNFIYLTEKYSQETLANELKTHIEDIKEYTQEMGVTFIYEKNLRILLKLLEKGTKNEIRGNN